MTSSLHNVTSTTSTTAEEHLYPAGHLNHLSQPQEDALRQFKTLLQEKSLYTPGPPASHDDATLLRFLRARRWNAQDALKQFKDTEEWRQANDIDVLYKTIDLKAYDAARRLYPQWTGRRDRRGIPIYLFEIKHLDSKTVADYEKAAASATDSKAKPTGKTPQTLMRLFALYENLTRFVQPLCTNLTDRDHANVPITLSSNIVDVSGVSLRQFWNLKNHMQAASQLATAHYPETLDRVYVIGAPMFFSTVWGWIKRWFDPITVSKIFILNAAETTAKLEEFIEPKNLPKKYGGELDFEWGHKPVLDASMLETVKFENGYTEFPLGPQYWRPIEGGRLELVAVGSVDGKDRCERVCTIAVSFNDAAAASASTAEQEKPVATNGVATEPVLEVSKPEVAAAGAVSEKPVATDGVATETVPQVSTDAAAEGVQKLSIADSESEKKPVENFEPPVITA